jgi:hypothetical protein
MPVDWGCIPAIIPPVPPYPDGAPVGWPPIIPLEGPWVSINLPPKPGPMIGFDSGSSHHPIQYVISQLQQKH